MSPATKARGAKLLLSLCAPALGGGLGFFLGGVFGAIAGALLAALLGELLGSYRGSRALQAYLKNPRASLAALWESKPGLWAICAFSLSFSPASLRPGLDGSRAAGRSGLNLRLLFLRRFMLENGTSTQAAELARIEDAARKILAEIPAPLLLEQFLSTSRLAQDGGLWPGLGACLSWAIYFSEDWASRGLGEGELGEFLAHCGYSPQEIVSSRAAFCGQGREDSADGSVDWELMGLNPGSDGTALKKNFRALSLAFHPDSLEALSPEQKEAAAEAYLRIKRAYERLKA